MDFIYEKDIEQALENKIKTSRYVNTREEAIAYAKQYWPAIAERMDYWEQPTCGECEYFTGEECGGKYEGNEAYCDDSACDEFERK